MTTHDTDATTATGTVRLTVVENSPDVTLDAYADLLDAELRVVRAHEGEPVPVADRLDELGDGLVVLGGHVSAYDDARAPWLPALRETLVAAATQGVPTLGICLGAQLLAVAGGDRWRSPPRPAARSVRPACSGVPRQTPTRRWRRSRPATTRCAA